MSQGVNRPRQSKIVNIFPFSSSIVKTASIQSPETSKLVKVRNDQEQFRCLIRGSRLYQNQMVRLDNSQKHNLNFSNPIRTSSKQNISSTHHMHQNSQSIPILPETLLRINFKTREKKKTIPSKKLQINTKITQNKSLSIFYRHQIISLYALLNRKQDYLNSLKNTDKFGDPLKPNQIEERLKKQIEMKGKDRGRLKFNHLTNEQLRSLKYKPKLSHQSVGRKNQKNNQVDEEEQEDEQEQNEHRPKKIQDINSWKRQNGVGFNQKVFIIKGGYHQLRKTLLDKGWYENQDVWSPFFDLKWTTKICDINYYDLKSGQAVNHFNNNHHLTSKYGITRRLRTLALAHQIDTDRFYPRCFDLGDQIDFQNFVENFKFGFAESVVRRFLVEKKRYEGLQAKIRISVDILRRRTIKFSSLVNLINKNQFPTITPEEWMIITETAELSPQALQQKLQILRKDQTENPNDPEYLDKVYQKLDEKVRKYLDILRANDPQIDINGWKNVWIAKPNFLSRGRGIRCFNNLYDISDYCLGRDVQFVVQKYIENPLLVGGKKFDIRQWVLIQDYAPPKIWFYQECYIRFCADDYSLDNIYNRFIHLTNNSVQKYSKNHIVEKSMWTMKEFAQFVGEQKWKIIKEKMMNIVVWSIKACQGHVTGKKGSCQLVGYDFMIDEFLNPWLIEINMSPSMDYSTPVTKRLVKMVLQDTGKIICGKKNKDTGLFSCIYRGNEDNQKFNIYKY